MIRIHRPALRGLLASAMFAASAAAYAVPAPVVCPDAGSTIDLTVAGNTTTINDAIYTAVDTNGSVGTGNFPSFYKVQGDDCIQGYNTNGTEEFETQNAPLFTFLLSTTDVVDVGGSDYVEFHLDINQEKSEPGLSLDNVQIFASTDDQLTGWTDCLLGGVACIYNMDAGANQSILLNYVQNKGSGNGYDMQLFVPVSVFAGLDPTTNYVYLYSAFGSVGDPYSENDGFEEWAYRRCPEGQVCWQPPGGGDPPPGVPEPGTLALIGLALLIGAVTTRRRFARIAA
jgi:hypothetical protein